MMKGEIQYTPKWGEGHKETLLRLVSIFMSLKLVQRENVGLRALTDKQSLTLYWWISESFRLSTAVP